MQSMDTLVSLASEIPITNLGEKVFLRNSHRRNFPNFLQLKANNLLLQL